MIATHLITTGHQTLSGNFTVVGNLSAQTYQGTQPVKWDSVYTSYQSASGNYAVKNQNNFFTAVQTFPGLSSTGSSTLSTLQVVKLGVNTASSIYTADINGSLNASGNITGLGTATITGQVNANGGISTTNLSASGTATITGRLSANGAIATTSVSATNALNVYGGAGEVDIIGAYGCQFQIRTAEAELTLSSSNVATALIPAGSICLGVTSRVTQAIAPTVLYGIGYPGETIAWGNNISGVALNSTTTSANFTDWMSLHPSSENVVVSALSGGAFTTGRIRLAAHYFILTAPTS